MTLGEARITAPLAAAHRPHWRSYGFALRGLQPLSGSNHSPVGGEAILCSPEADDPQTMGQLLCGRVAASGTINELVRPK